MGHRALVAYERPNSTYNIHHSHWGALDLRLQQQITPETPLGGEAADEQARERFHELLSRTGGDEGREELPSPDRPTGIVDPDPVAIDLSFEAIITEHLDFLHHEALYVVNQEFDVTAHQTLWVGLQYDCSTVIDAPTIGNGALVHVKGQYPIAIDHENLRTKWATSKDILGDGIDQGLVPTETATKYLREKLAEWTPPGTELQFTDQFTIGSSTE